MAFTWPATTFSWLCVQRDHRFRDFNLIVSCGIASCPVTSLKEVSDPKSQPDLESLAHRAARQFGQVLGEPIEFFENLDALREQIKLPLTSTPEPQKPDYPAPAFPAEDTPLTVPPEIERLRRTKIALFGVARALTIRLTRRAIYNPAGTKCADPSLNRSFLNQMACHRFRFWSSWDATIFRV